MTDTGIKSTKLHPQDSYRFSKNHGILIVESQTDFAKAVYESNCLPWGAIELRRYLGVPIQFTEVSPKIFSTLLIDIHQTKKMAPQKLMEGINENLELSQLATHISVTSDILESETSVPVINLINALLREAIAQSASDIHFETFEKILGVRFRIDGLLHNILEVPYLLSPLVISRLKIMAKLDISEKRLPQDGRITIKVADKIIDVRVSTIPVNHGERMVLRLLDKHSHKLNMTELGLSQDLLNIVKRMIIKPHGMLLVTGPTGSGKTTSLYAMLSELDISGRNIMTVEDPIEYELPGVSQIQINNKMNLGFARILRAILRQDPNIIMIGEIRDLETAEIAVQASLTGHFVLSTLHTNTAIGTITRLRDIGVEPFLLSSSLIGIIAQRLVRLLCQFCKKPQRITENERVLFGAEMTHHVTIYSPQGCEHCNKTGYKGRIGIYEIIEIDSTLQNMIHENANEQKMSAYVKQVRMSIWQNGCQRVLSGETSLEEVIRVTNDNV